MGFLYDPSSLLLSKYPDVLRQLPEEYLRVMFFASRAIPGLILLIVATLTFRRPVALTCASVLPVALLLTLQVFFAQEKKDTGLAWILFLAEFAVYIIAPFVLMCVGNVACRIKIPFVAILLFFSIQECFVFKNLFLSLLELTYQDLDLVTQVGLEVAYNLAQACNGAAFLFLLHFTLEEAVASNTEQEEKSPASVHLLIDLNMGENTASGEMRTHGEGNQSAVA